MEGEIKEEFIRSGFSLQEEEVILKKCLTFCINYKLSASDLVTSWEIYYLNRQLSGSVVEDAHMDGFLSHLQSEQLECIVKEEPSLHVYSSNDADMFLRDTHEDKLGFLGTPQKMSESSQFEAINRTPRADDKTSSFYVSSNQLTPFGQRVKKFVLQTNFSTHKEGSNISEHDDVESKEDEFIRRVRPGARCSFKILSSQPQQGCRFMYDRTEDRFNFLEGRIRQHTLAFVGTGLFGEPTDAAMASQKSIFVVGMVCCDGEGRLNEKSVLLQGSVEHSAGHRVRLDLQKLAQFSLFPGQVIGIEGHNPTGLCLIALKIVDSLPMYKFTKDVLSKKRALDQAPEPTLKHSEVSELSMIIAAGPFTTTDNLLFEPLTELLAYAKRRQPQLLMLMGPFIDSGHPEIKMGTVDRSFDDIFFMEVIKRLHDYAEYMAPTATVLLVPSIRDANHDFVFPQPAFAVSLSKDLNSHLIFLPNPGFFTVNEVVIGCCTVDVLKQLSSEEIWRMPAGSLYGDRMGRLASHLLSQKSFYPLYPPSKGVPLDLSLAPEALRIAYVPNLLVLPSDLGPFVKLLPVGEEKDASHVKCVCVNPGRLAKGIGGGTFVDLNFHEDLDKITASVIKI